MRSWHVVQKVIVRKDEIVCVKDEIITSAAFWVSTAFATLL